MKQLLHLGILILAALVIVGATITFASTEYASTLQNLVGGEQHGARQFSGNEFGNDANATTTTNATFTPPTRGEHDSAMQFGEITQNGITQSVMVATVIALTQFWKWLKPKRALRPI